MACKYTYVRSLMTLPAGLKNLHTHTR